MAPPGCDRSKNAPLRNRDPAMVSSLNRLYMHRNRLEDTWAETEPVRAYLDAKQEALERVDSLEEHIAALRQSLRRIETLRGELATREAELKALESSEQLAELEANIREDLLNEK